MCLFDRNPFQELYEGFLQPDECIYFISVSDQLQSFFDVYAHLHKQWHFRMKKISCRDLPIKRPTNLPNYYPTFNTNTSYPAGTVCTLEDTPEDPICLTGGESGSPLMSVQAERHTAEGVMSFTRSCLAEIGTKGSRPNKEVLKFTSTSPNVYTKLSCFLPWVAKQYGLVWDNPEPEDPECNVVQGDPADFNQTYCGTLPDQNVQELGAGQQLPLELPCIFPYFLDEKRYDGCLQFSTNGFVIPSFYCPVFNSTVRKWDNITQQYLSSFKSSESGNNAVRPTDEMCFVYVKQTIEFDYATGSIINVVIERLDVDPMMNTSNCTCGDSSNFTQTTSTSGTSTSITLSGCQPNTTYQPFVQCRNNCKGGEVVIPHQSLD